MKFAIIGLLILLAAAVLYMMERFRHVKFPATYPLKTMVAYAFPYLAMLGVIIFWGYLGVAVFVLAYVCFGLFGRCFIQIPQNHVAGVFLFGRRLKYVVSNADDYQKLMAFEDASHEKVNAGKVQIAIDPFGLLSAVFNVRLYSWNPLASIMPVQIYRNHWKEPAKVSENDKLRDRLELPCESEDVKFLRIDSTLIGIDEDVELRGKDKSTNIVRINLLREANVRVTNLDAIYLTQHGKFSSFLNETIKAGVTNYLKTLDFDTFSTSDFSEASKTFDNVMRRYISGVYGAEILSMTIPDWEYSEGQEAIIKAQLEAEAAKKLAEADAIRGEGRRKFLAREGAGEAVAVNLRMRAYQRHGVTGDIAAMADGQIQSAHELAQSPSITTVIQGQGASAMPVSYAINASQSQRRGGNKPQQRRNS